MISSLTQIRVRYAETDAMGITYHANYLPWLEMARVRFLDEIGLPYREIEKMGFFMPVLEANLKYLRPSRFDDEVQVHLSIKERPSVKLRVDYEVRRGGELLVKAYTLHAFMNAAGEAIRPPDVWREKMRELFARAQKQEPPQA